MLNKNFANHILNVSLILFLGCSTPLLAKGKRAGQEQEDKNPLDEIFTSPVAPTPLTSVEEVDKKLKAAKIPETKVHPDLKKFTPYELVGVVSLNEKGRLGFMPLNQHHMAVEHWFVEGWDEEALKKELKPPLNALVVRLKGEQALVKAYSCGEMLMPSEGERVFWGNGLAHGGTYSFNGGEVMGYHERVYRYKCDSIVWKTPINDYLTARRNFALTQNKLFQLCLEGDVAAARKYWKALEKSSFDLNFNDLKQLEDDVDYLIETMPLLTQGKDLGDYEIERLANFYIDYEDNHKMEYQYKESVVAAYDKLIQKLKPEDRARLGDALVDVYLKIKGKHLLFKRIETLKSPKIEWLKQKIEEVTPQIVNSKKDFQSLATNHDYTKYLKLYHDICYLQMIAVPREFNAFHLRNSIKTLTYLQSLEALNSQDLCKKLITKIPDMISNSVHGFAKVQEGHLGLNKELAEVFLPKLDDAHKKQFADSLIQYYKNNKKRYLTDETVTYLLGPVAGSEHISFLKEALKNIKEDKYIAMANQIIQSVQAQN